MTELAGSRTGCDHILRRALEELGREVPVPDPEPSLNRLLAELTAARRRRRARRWAGSGAAAALLALSFLASPEARSRNPWQVAIRFFAGAGDTALVQYGIRENDAGRTAPAPPEEPEPAYRETGWPPAAGAAARPGGQAGGESSAPEVRAVEPPPPEEISLDDAARRARFAVRFPEWLPADTRVVRVVYRPSATPEGAAEVQIHLGGPEGRDLHLSQAGPIRQFGSGRAFDRTQVEVREVEVDGARAILLAYRRDGSSSLQWFSAGVLYDIRSDWDGETTLRIARSLRPVLRDD